MIHYTLLPPEKMKSLKRDYRMRIFVTLMLFVSSAVIVGILSLVPSYIVSYTQEKEFVGKIQKIQENRAIEGIDKIIAELNKSSVIVRRLKSDKPKISFLADTEKILSLRTKNVTLTSFEIASSSQESGIAEIVIEGKALTREALLTFKKAVEADESISNVVLPISDLAKSRDIGFAMKFIIKN